MEVLGSDGRLKDRTGTAPQSVVFRAVASSNITSGLANNTWQDVKINSKDFDPYNWYDPSTGRFTPKIAGYYRLSGALRFAGGQRYMKISKNNTKQPLIDASADVAASGGKVVLSGTVVHYLNGSTDYATIQGWSNGFDGNGYFGVSTEEYTWFEGELIGVSVGVMPEPWHVIGTTGEPAFQNGWVNYTVGFQVARFCKDPFGWVHVEGFVRSGGASTNIFTLPVGYRPSASLRFPQSAGSAYGQIDVRSDGTLGHLVGSTSDFSINCDFKAEA